MEGAQPLPEVAVVWVDVLPRPWAGVARRLQLTAGAQCGSRANTRFAAPGESAAVPTGLPDVATLALSFRGNPVKIRKSATCSSTWRATALRERPAVNPRTWRPACSRRVIASARGGGTYAEHCALTWNAPDPHGPPAATLPPGA